MATEAMLCAHTSHGSAWDGKVPAVARKQLANLLLWQILVLGCADSTPYVSSLRSLRLKQCSVPKQYAVCCPLLALAKGAHL